MSKLIVNRVKMLRKLSKQHEDIRAAINRHAIELLNTSVTEIEFSVRVKTCLDRAEIRTVGQLVTKSDAELLKYRTIGKKSLKEIRDRLRPFGIIYACREFVVIQATSDLFACHSIGQALKKASG